MALCWLVSLEYSLLVGVDPSELRKTGRHIIRAACSIVPKEAKQRLKPLGTKSGCKERGPGSAQYAVFFLISIFRFVRTQQFRIFQDLSHEDYDILLMKAGLRNLLGVEETLGQKSSQF